MVNKKSKKTYIEGLWLIIKHKGSWEKFKKALKYKKSDENLSLKEELVALGNLNLLNYNQGRDSFYQAEADDLIGERLTEARIIKNLNTFFKRLCKKDIFEEIGHDEYRLHIFAAKGPSSQKFIKKPHGNKELENNIFFFSHDRPEYLQYFEKLATERRLSAEITCKVTKELHELREEMKSPSGLVIPKNEYELINCFDTLRDFHVKVVYREAADFLLRLFWENDFKIVVEGPPMAGKSTFAYLVARDLVDSKLVGIVKGKLNEADINFMKIREHSLVIVDAGDVDLFFDMELYSSLRFARKLLILRRKGEPRNPDVRAALDNFSFIEDFFKQKMNKPTGKIRCELDKMENIIDIINTIENASKIRVDDEVKKEIYNICISSDGKHSILGFIKAVYIGLASLRSSGEIGDFITFDEFRKIGGMKLKEYNASEKRLEHIYTWLDDDIKKLLKVFKFLNEKLAPRSSFEKKIVEEAYSAYHGEEIPEITIEKAKNIGILQEELICTLSDFRLMPLVGMDSLSSYYVWHPWQIEIIELHKKTDIIFDKFIDELINILEKKLDFRSIILTISPIRECDNKLASYLFNKLNKDIILNGLKDNFENFKLPELCWLLPIIKNIKFYWPNEYEDVLLRQLDIEKLRASLERLDIHLISICLKEIFNNIQQKSIIERLIDIDFLKIKIRQEQDLGKIYICESFLNTVFDMTESKKIKELIKTLDFDDIICKLKEAENRPA